MGAHRQSGSRQSPPPDAGDRPGGDPWHAFGYIVSGVGVYGAGGWFLDRWLGTTFLVAVGILIGAGFGIYMTFARFNTAGGAAGSTSTSAPEAAPGTRQPHPQD
jgi:ATP synthase protein I